MLYITGDCHHTDPFDGPARFSTRAFPLQKELNKEDFLLICGDFGFPWDNSPEDRWWINWLAQRSFSVLTLSGNHENFSLLKKYPQKPWRGGMVREIAPSVLHLCSGYVFDLGPSVFVMGGAQSHDMEVLLSPGPDLKQKQKYLDYRKIPYRIEGISWWPEELPGEMEYQTARNSLDEKNWKVDIVATHCAPHKVQRKVAPTYPENQLTHFLSELQDKLDYQQWYCGHYHLQQHLPEYRFRILYRDIHPVY